MRVIFHVVSVVILVFFIASFFIGLKTNPDFIGEMATSPYGLFSYFLVTLFTAFIPTLVTLPIVTTATLVWGPWIAGIVALIGWTIGNIIEYYIALSAVNSIGGWFKGRTARMGKKVKRVTDALSLWQIFIARLLVPPFVFGMVKTSLSQFIAVSILAHIPLIIIGILGGELLKDKIEQLQPLVVGTAFVLFIFTLDFLLSEKESHASDH